MKRKNLPQLVLSKNHRYNTVERFPHYCYSTMIIFLLSSMVSCAPYKKFQSPKIDMPTNYLYDTVSTSYADSVVSKTWWTSFNDPMLDSLITMALDSNKNIQMSALRVEQSRIELKQARSAMAPSFSLGVKAEGSYPNPLPMGDKITQSYGIEPSMQWEIDLFGKLKRAAESSRYQYLATEQDYRAIELSIASQVASAYFTLLEYDLSLRISQQTYELRREYQVLMDSMYHYGASSLLDLEQSRSLLASAAASIDNYNMAKSQALMSLCVLLGSNPTVIDVDGSKLLNYHIPGVIPAGLPSSLLNRRPDILQSYYSAASASAQVGVAIANRYPSLVLTGEGGVISSTLKGLFSGNPFGWAASLSLAEPIFAFGRNKRAVEIAKLAYEESIINYEQTVITALSEVNSSLIGISSYSSQVSNLKQLVNANYQAQYLTRQLYDNGDVTYLNVLDAEREYFSSQLNLSTTLSAWLTEYVSLYKSLGGGW